MALDKSLARRYAFAMSMRLVSREVDEDGSPIKPVMVKLADGNSYELRFTAGTMMDLLDQHNIDLHRVATQQHLLDGVVRRFLPKIIIAAARDENDDPLTGVTEKLVRNLDHVAIPVLVNAIADRLRADFSRMEKAVPDPNEKKETTEAPKTPDAALEA